MCTVMSIPCRRNLFFVVSHICLVCYTKQLMTSSNFITMEINFSVFQTSGNADLKHPEFDRQLEILTMRKSSSEGVLNACLGVM